jgi:hypothetical protein
MSDSYQSEGNINDKYKVWFFAGGETRDDKFNTFTGSFIGIMKSILGDNFDFIRGVNFKAPMMNVIWALNNAQKPITHPEKERKLKRAIHQIVETDLSPETQLIITSSSSGSVLAAQTACCLAQMNLKKRCFYKPFHLVLGASMISQQSALYKELIHHQEQGNIGIILHDEMQDDGDTSFGVGGITRMEAYRNSFGLIFPFLSRKFNGPSFLNTDPVTGHIHRRRSQTLKKAIDYINIILIQNNLAGDINRETAKTNLYKFK